MSQKEKNNKTKTIHSVFTLFTLILCLTLSQTISAKVKDPEDKEKKKTCDKVIMHSFKLEGMEFPHKPFKMTICPDVSENCCTVVDELAILKFWNEFTMEKWKKFSSYVLYIVGNIINFQPYVEKFGIGNVPLFFTRKETYRYLTYSCSSIETSGKYLPFKLIRKKMNGRMLRLKKKMLLGVFKGDHKKLERYLIDEKRIEKEHFKQMKKNKSAKTGNKRNKPMAPIMIDGLSNDERNQLMAKMTKKEKNAFIQQHKVMIEHKDAVNKARYRILRDVRVMGKSMTRKLEEVSQHLLNKMDEAGDYFEHYLTKTHVDFEPLLSKYQDRVDNFIKTGQYYFEQLPKFVKYDFKGMDEFLTHIQSHLIDNLDAAYKILEQGGTPKKDFMVDLLTQITKSHFPDMLIPNIPELELDPIKIPPLSLPKIQCTQRWVPQTKTLLVLNSPKFEFCSNALGVILKIKMQEYGEYLSRVKSELVRLISVKKGLYCAICDVDIQKFIDYKNNVIAIDRSFCGNYIADFQFYFDFMNVTFIKYIEALFQYIQCTYSQGDELNFPFFTIAEKKKRMAILWKRCFNSLGTKNEFKFCYFICSEFRYDRNTEVIEGDLDYLKTVYFEIISFMRKSKMHMVKTLGRYKKIDWNQMDSPLVHAEKVYHPKKDIKEISKWTPNLAAKELAKKGLYSKIDAEIDSKNVRILEQLHEPHEDDPEVNIFDPMRLVKQYAHLEDDEFNKKIKEDPYLSYEQHKFYSPSSVSPPKIKQRHLEEIKASSLPERELSEKKKKKKKKYKKKKKQKYALKKSLKQGFESFIRKTMKEVDVNNMRKKFLKEQKIKALEKEEPSVKEGGVKKEEIFERVELTVDISNMEHLFLKKKDGIHPMAVVKNSLFDMDQQKFIKVNLSSIQVESLGRETIIQGISTTEKDIKSFQDDINIDIKNAKNEKHVFKPVFNKDSPIKNDKDFYRIEEGKLQDKLNGTEIKEDIDDGTFDPYKNVKVDLTQPDQMTLDQEIQEKLEKNPRVGSIHDVVKHFRE
jgi:hypothetical protein